MDQNLTEIVCVVDRSGSMGVIQDDARGGFNQFVQDQKKVPGKAKLTLVLFDNEYIVAHDGLDIQQVPDLTPETYVPRGTTALYDAIGRAVTTVGERLANTPEHERPGKVIVVILTDGQENASQEYNKARILEMITHQREVYRWEFMYLSADAAAFADGQAIGINLNVQFDQHQVKSSYAFCSSAVAQYRATGHMTNDDLGQLNDALSGSGSGITTQSSTSSKQPH